MLKRRFGWVLFAFSGVALGSSSCSVSRTGAHASGGVSGGNNAANGGRATGGKSGGGAASAGSNAAGGVGGGTANAGTGGSDGAMSAGAGGDAGFGGEGALEPGEHCSAEPCMNGGTCMEAASGFSCACAVGYEGERCETNTDDCASKPCQNGGTCKDGVATHTCTCPKGFSGNDCERRVQDCNDAPCLNGASCTDQTDGYTCTCKAGFSGDRCENNVDDCATNPCKNGATCTDGVAAHSCQCKNGFKGDNCEINIDDCPNSACQNGTCVDGVASYTCQCDSRHTGPACEFIEFKLAGSLYGTDPTRVTGISGDGSVVLLQSSGENGENVARMVDFGNIDVVELWQLKAVARYGRSISHDGSVIVGQSLQGDTYLPFELQLNNARTLYMGSLPAGSGDALDVSADGATIVGYWAETDTGIIQAFRHTAAGVEYVGTLSNAEFNQQATAVSGDGSIVAGTTMGADALPSRSWRWTASTKKTQNVELLTGAWVNPTVADISTDGKVLVGSVMINGVRHAVRWLGDSAKAEDLGPGNLLATNVDGSVSVGEDIGGNAAIWTATLKAKTIASLIGDNPDLAGAKLFQASAVSEDGKVVAGTASLAGAKQGWVAHL